MTSISWRSMRLLVAVVAATLGLAVLAPQASAVPLPPDPHPTAYRTQEQVLAVYPSDWMRTTCQSRSIRLLAGGYEWGTWFDGYRYLPRDIYLGAANYTWRSCLDPKDGYYLHTSSLDPVDKPWPTASFTVEVAIDSIYDYERHTWGSYLDPDS